MKRGSKLLNQCSSIGKTSKILKHSGDQKYVIIYIVALTGRTIETIKTISVFLDVKDQRKWPIKYMVKYFLTGTQERYKRNMKKNVNQIRRNVEMFKSSLEESMQELQPKQNSINPGTPKRPIQGSRKRKPHRQ